MTPMQHLVKQHGGPAAFARLTGIPFRTVQCWHREGYPDGRTPPPWLTRNLTLSAACLSDAATATPRTKERR